MIHQGMDTSILKRQTFKAKVKNTSVRNDALKSDRGGEYLKVNLKIFC